MVERRRCDIPPLPTGMRTVTPLSRPPAGDTIAGMAVRDEVDITVLLSEVVAPALRSVFKAGELDSVNVAWEEPVPLPDGTLSAPTALNVHLVCKGERHTSNLWTVGGMPGYEREALAEQLVEEFSNFVAESQFGWGQQR